MSGESFDSRGIEGEGLPFQGVDQSPRMDDCFSMNSTCFVTVRD